MAAPTLSEHPETREYYAAQVALAALLSRELRVLPPTLNPADLAGTAPDLWSLIAALTGETTPTAVTLAGDYYEDLRATQVGGTYRADLIEAPTLALIERQIEAASQELMASIDAVPDDIYLAGLTLQVQAEAEGIATAAVANAGRDQILSSVSGDREARGWVRVVRPGACSFCRMLALRGPVFSETTVAFRAHVPIDGRGGTCQCTAEPWFGERHEPTAQVRADQAIWDAVSEAGFTGAAARNEFRRRLEGRTDGPRKQRQGASGGTTSTREVNAQRPGFDALTPAQLRQQLDVLAKLPPSKYRDRQTERVRSRLVALGA